MTHLKRFSSAIMSGIIAVSTLTPTFTHPRVRYRYKTNNAGEVVTGALIIGGLAAGIFALGSWFFSSTDQEVLDRAHNSYAQAARRYSHAITMLEREWNSDLRLAAVQEVCRWESERFLKEMITEIGSPYSYRADLATIRNSLQQQAAKLRKRATKKKCQYSNSMLDLAQQIKDLEVKLSFLHDFVRKNESFFTLYATYTQLLDRYTYAVSAQAYPHTGHTWGVNQEIQVMISNYGLQIGSFYPYLDYVERLTQNRAVLISNISALNDTQLFPADRYPLIAQASALSDQLNTLKHTIMSSSEYRQSQLDYERMRLEQERLRLEQERLRLERERLLHPPIVFVQQLPRPEPIIVIEQPRPQEQVVIVHEQRPTDQVIVVERERDYYDGHDDDRDDLDVRFEVEV